MTQIDARSGSALFLSGVVVGTLAGALAALWMAPQSGRKTQKLIRQEALRLQQTAEHAVDDLKDGVENAADDVRETVQGARHDSRGWLHQRAAQASRLSVRLHNAVSQ